MIGLKSVGCGVAHMIGFCSVQQYLYPCPFDTLNCGVFAFLPQLISAIDFQKAEFEEMG